MIFEKASEFKNKSITFCMITMIKVRGSAPQDLGAKCIVTAQGLETGTVGGGKIEAYAIAHAQKCMKEEKFLPQTHTWNLQKDIGMTCGGEVSFLFEFFPAITWPIAIFGAGHVAQALTRTMANLPCQMTCIDDRKEWIDQLDNQANLTKILTENPPSCVKDLRADSYFISMTQGHAKDLPVLIEIYKNFPQAKFVGVIGSETKGKKLKKELLENNVSQEFINKIHIPIGLNFGTNHPYEISISIVSQLLQYRDK